MDDKEYLAYYKESDEDYAKYMEEFDRGFQAQRDWVPMNGGETDIWKAGWRRALATHNFNKSDLSWL